jgi:hypothetical protein
MFASTTHISLTKIQHKVLYKQLSMKVLALGGLIRRFDQDVLRAAFAEMIIVDELLFSFGEKARFRKFMSKACPRF